MLVTVIKSNLKLSIYLVWRRYVTMIIKYVKGRRKSPHLQEKGKKVNGLNWQQEKFKACSRCQVLFEMSGTAQNSSERIRHRSHRMQAPLWSRSCRSDRASLEPPIVIWDVTSVGS